MSDTPEQDNFDIFISYTHKDNRGLGYEWVSEFKEDLNLRIEQIDSEVKIFFDKGQDAIGGTLPVLIANILTNSEYLMPIVSPLYTKSRWCRDERKAFFEHYGMDAEKRIIRIDKMPVREMDMPVELEDLLGFQFHYKDDAEGITYEISRKNKPDEYYKLITRLAIQIVDMLKIVRQSRDNTIYLAWTSENLEDKRSQIKKELDRLGFNVIPNDLGFNAGKAKSRAGENLDTAFMSIHLIDEAFEPLVRDETVGIDQIQFEEAKQRIDKLKVYVWTPTIKPDDPNQAALLEVVENTNVTDLFHNFQDFKDEVVNAAVKHRQL